MYMCVIRCVIVVVYTCVIRCVIVVYTCVISVLLLCTRMLLRCVTVVV